ncbi:MAG: hypothetical protein MUC49_08730 [Raineya sp.]|jgi:hypothetical protein|nr:hypothetical protein [Raineya sp.]
MEKVYIREVNELHRAKKIEENLHLHEHELKDEYKRLLENFEEAIGQMRLITNVSDKIQKKLDKANAALDQKNQELDFKNKELQVTIDQLTQARAGKIATTIVLILAIILFLIEEVLLEPLIVDFVSTNQWVSIGIKLFLVLSLKPIESVMENVVLNYIYKRKLGLKSPEKI